jgi:SAM-dependent methyltransferase
MTLRRRVRRKLRDPYLLFARTFFDPIASVRDVVNRLRAFPIFLSHLIAYSRRNQHSTLRYRTREAWYRSYDRWMPAGTIQQHYFLQDLWAATVLYESKTDKHVDVGSRVDGFIGHALAFCDVTYVDIRPLNFEHPRFHFMEGSIVELPFADDSVQSLSSLHVIEHIGLGRYGDPVDPDGHLLAAREMTRVLAHGGRLLIGVPTGRERLCFDAHRIFDPSTVTSMFAGLRLKKFAFIDDLDGQILDDVPFDVAREAHYGCGLYEFTKD